MNIVFFGSDDFAVPSLRALTAEDSVRVAAVVTSPDRPAGRGMTMTPTPIKIAADELNIPVYQPIKPAAMAPLLRESGVQAMVVCAYGYLLSRRTLAAPRFGGINIHASLLPKWRGASPVEKAILAGDKTTGVSIMEMDCGLDTGGILMREEIPIANQTGGELRNQLADIGAKLIAATMRDLRNLPSIPQDDSQATYAPKITKDDARINWNQSAEELERQVRAFSPSPGAFAFYGDELIKIHRAEIAEKIRSGDSPSGVVLKIGDGKIAVQCGGKSALELLSLQRAGGRILSADEFLRGRQIAVGGRFLCDSPR